ncbi:hypothetical protein FE374_05745 [Georgenia yuyongxinii]|uniref:Uncharacterized protein n=1 Tax=Georgenia yuyongxinii TaxID=2589797 RepID=A0A5B8C8C3_9MICO|nr:hypothetical protein [Georgenia yuyongxinii]QDC24196.1 hypothetical protein FE374_05745 [Georgenia yuyongxinii]
MSEHTTTAPSPAPASYRCEHCDDSVPHEHLDVAAIVGAARRSALVRAVTMIATAVVVIAVAMVVAVGAAGTGAAVSALTITMVGWAVATAIGVAVVGAVRGRSSSGALIVGALTTAALAPVVALAVAVLARAGWAGALVAGGGWLLCGAVATLARARTLRALLLTEGDAGERARAGAVAKRAQAGRADVVRWLSQGVLVGVSAWLLTLLPVLVVVLVPLAVVLAVAAARPRTGR